MNIIVVNFNYRVGPYGFLASSEVLADGSINNGLKDQRKALQWVQQYISLFGGDPSHVTMGTYTDGHNPFPSTAPLLSTLVGRCTSAVLLCATEIARDFLGYYL